MKKKKQKANEILLKIINIPEITAIVPLIILVVVTSSLNPVFLKPANLATLGGITIGCWGLYAIGQAFVIIVGEIDLSMGAVFAFAAIFLSFMISKGVPLFLSILLTFCITVGFELINAFVVLKLNVPVFIATLGMQYIAKGLAKVVNSGAALSIYSCGQPFVKEYCDTLSYKLFGVSIAFLSFIVLIFVAQFVLQRTSFGRRVFAVGDNKKVARMAGIPVEKVKMQCFVIVGVLIGLASVLWVAGKHEYYL